MSANDYSHLNVRGKTADHSITTDYAAIMETFKDETTWFKGNGMGKLGTSRYCHYIIDEVNTAEEADWKNVCSTTREWMIEARDLAQMLAETTGYIRTGEIKVPE